MSGSASDLLKFIDESPTPFHVVAHSETLLNEAGFKLLNELDSWKGAIQPGGKYFYHRNKSTLVAFTVGNKYQAGNEFKVIGAHTDSPVLKVKPVSKRTSNGYMQVGVECYGGGLWHTWFDRDLTLAGCVVVKQDDGRFVRRLVNLKKPMLRIPNLCIHLQNATERESFAVNKEIHLQPILAMVQEDLNKDGESTGDKRHHSVLLQMLADNLSVPVDSIVDLELSLADTQPGATWGPKDEFLSCPRLDNQVHCYTGLSALLSHKVEEDTGISMLVAFDHEEVGSDSAQGAGSPVMSEAISRILGTFDTSDELLRITVRKSLLISADVAHAVHPNYADKHEAKHSPNLNKGTVIKTNQNQRYATNAETGFIIRELARKADVPVQEFVVRNDRPCGSTIGPIIASKVGIRTVDLGIPSLSMHSIRETMGCADVITNIKLFQQFYNDFGALDSKCDF